MGPEAFYCTGDLAHVLLILVQFSLDVCSDLTTFLGCSHLTNSAGMFKFYQGTPRYTCHHYYLPNHLQYWISFHSLVETRPFTLHGSTKDWIWWGFECHAPAKVVVLVGSGVGRKLSLRTMESLILFAIRVATRDGL